jgi:hypothetical protein
VNGPLKPDFETLSAYLDDELEPSRRAAVQAWLDAHPEERGELERMRERERRIARGPAPRDPREGEAPEPALDVDALTRNVWDEIDRQRDRAAGRSFWIGRGFPTRPAVWIPVAAAAAVFLLFQNPPKRPVEPMMQARRGAVTVPAAKAPAPAPLAKPQAAPPTAERAAPVAPGRPPETATTAQAPPSQSAPRTQDRAATTLVRGGRSGEVRTHVETAPTPAAPAPVALRVQSADRMESVPPTTTVTGDRPAVRMKANAKPEGKPGELSEKPVDNVIEVTAKSEGIRSRDSSVRGGGAPMTTHARMTRWLNLVALRGLEEARRATPGVGPADSIAATTGFWVAEPGPAPDSTDRTPTPHRREALAWALTEKYLATRNPADCAAAREALRAAFHPFPGANLETFLRECWRRLGECAGGPAPG